MTPTSPPGDPGFVPPRRRRSSSSRPPRASRPVDPDEPHAPEASEADTDSDTDAAAAERAELLRRRRLAVGGGALAVIVLLVAAISSLGGDDATRDTDGRIRVDAWAPYWAFDRSLTDIEIHGSVLHEVSPFVYLATGVDSITLDPSADPETVEAFFAAARDEGIPVVPSILDSLPSGEMAAILGDPSTRADHIDTIMALVLDDDHDGIDIDYEQFAFADDRSTWPESREAFAAFVSELGARLHDEGRTLTVSIPPVYDAGTTDASGYWVYDYRAIAAAADRIRVMAYDYSGQAAGPISPIDWVQRAIDGAVEASGAPEKIVLGIPLYGNNVPVATSGPCPENQTIGRTAVTIRTVGDLIDKRDAVPVYDAERAEWTFSYQLEATDGETSCLQTRQVNYVDSDGALARIELAIDAGLGGVSLWALGYEDDSLWAAIDPVVLAPDR